MMKTIFYFFFAIGWTGVNLAQAQPELVIQEGHTNDIIKIAAHPNKDLIATADKNVVKVWDSRSWKIIISNQLVKEDNTDWVIFNLEFDQSNQLIITLVELLPDPRNFFVSHLMNTRKSISINIASGKIYHDEPPNLIVPRKNQENLLIYQINNSIVFQSQGNNIYDTIFLEENLHDPDVSWFFQSKVQLQISFAQFNSEESFLFCGYTDGSVELRNPNTFDVLFRIETEISQITDIHFSGNDSIICEGLNDDDKIVIIDLKNHEVLRILTHDCSNLDQSNFDYSGYSSSPLISNQVCNFGIDYHKPSGWLAIGLQYNRIHFINLISKVEKFIESPFFINTDLAFNNDGSELIISGIYKVLDSNAISQSPVQIYNLDLETFSNTPNITFDYTTDIGWSESGDAFYALNLSSFTKWSTQNLSRIQSNVIHKSSGGYTNFIKGSHNSLIEIPPFYDQPLIIRHLDSNKQDRLNINFLKSNEENESIIKLAPNQFVITSSNSYSYPFSPDHFYVYDLTSKKLVYTFRATGSENVKLSQSGQWLAYYNEDAAQLKLVETHTWNLGFKYPIDRKTSSFFNVKNNFSFSEDDQRFAFYQDRNNELDSNSITPPDLHHIQVYQLSDEVKWKSSHSFRYGDPINILAFGHQENTIITGTNIPPYNIQIWDFTTGKIINELHGHSKPIELIADHREMLFSKSEDNTYRLWDKNKSKESIKILNSFNGLGPSEIIMNEDNYYMSNNDGLRLIGYKLNDKGYPFEQFDLVKNRPDKVIAEMPRIDTSLISAYSRAYEKRLEKIGFSQNVLNESFNIPIININTQSNEIQSLDKYITIEINASDEKELLDRINVWVNDVPIFGQLGLYIRENQVYKFDTSIDIELSKGKNKIQVSAMNITGGESIKETLVRHFKSEFQKSDLYLLAIANSKYRNSNKNLEYPTIDMDSLIESFYKQNDFYNKIHVKKLYDKDVNVNNIKAIKVILQNSKVDDKVIIAYAGHGLVDDNLDYYLSTYEIDFSNPKERGLAYYELENILDSIPSRNKLLLVDACHSGEIDKSYLERIQSTNQKDSNLKFRAVGDTTITHNKLGIYNSFELMKQLFIDLRRSTGATVIASSGAVEYALESNTWGNSAFIHTLLTAINRKRSDGHVTGLKDGIITISELSAYLADKVPELTNGLQQPTSRVYNFENDWAIWY